MFSISQDNAAAPTPSASPVPEPGSSTMQESVTCAMPKELTLETLTDTLPLSSEQIEADDDIDAEILKKAFGLLSNKNDLKAFLKQDESCAVTALDQYDQGLLHYAIHQGLRESAELLIGSGVSIRQQAATGLQAIHIAAIRGDVRCLTLLQYKGAFHYEYPVTISLQDEVLQVNALQMAVLFGHMGAIDFLFDLYKKSDQSFSRTILHLAVLANRPDSLACLLKQSFINTPLRFDEKFGLHQEIPLHLAKRLGHTECAELLQHHMLQHGVDTSRTASHSPGFFAAQTTPVDRSSPSSRHGASVSH